LELADFELIRDFIFVILLFLNYTGRSYHFS
jgi:hypothetical protein